MDGRGAIATAHHATHGDHDDVHQPMLAIASMTRIRQRLEVRTDRFHVHPFGGHHRCEDATWQNTIGASELGTVWTDPDFDANECVLLRPRDRDPDTALGCLRCVPLRHRTAGGREADRGRMRRHVTDLVHAVTRLRNR